MFINPAETLLVVVDMQERLAPAMSDFDACAERVELLIKGAGVLRLDTLVTEQYPRGLGATLPRFSALLQPETPVVSKTGFSVFVEPGFRTILNAKPRKQLIFCGIESHVCVLQSVFDALDNGYEVFLAADAVTSRKTGDRKLALAAARDAGAYVVSAESILFMLLGDAQNPAFKAISALVR